MSEPLKPVSPKPSKSLLRRIAALFLFVFVPLALVVAAVGLSGKVISAVSERLSQQSAYRSHQQDFVSEATRAAEASAQGEASAGIVLVGGRSSYEQEPTPLPDLLLATNTPAPEVAPADLSFATNTPLPAQPAATATVPPVQTLVLPTLIFPDDPSADLISGAPTAVPTRIPPITRSYDLVNIVLLGSDEEITADNTIRTDTMIIVSINRETGTVNMMSLPRDLFVFVPGLGMRRLNVAYGWGEAVGWTGGGFGLFRDTIIYNLGINVHYYAKVNITQFEQIVDLVDGVDIAVDCAYQDWYPVAPIEELDLTKPIEENYYLRTLDVGYYTMDGFDAQWYARSRKNSSDFDRGRRQQKLVRAIFRKALDNGQISQLPALWNEGMAIVDTNLTLNDALSLVPIALNLNSRDIESFTLIPTYHTASWTAPDGANVQLPVYEALIPLLEDFYTPPTSNQVAVSGATVRVLNGTAKPDLDKVAADVLGESGFVAYAGGAADTQDYATTQMIDFTGQTKGSSAPEIAGLLNMPLANVTDQPDPNREADFTVILGADYNSCPGGVLPVEPVDGE